MVDGLQCCSSIRAGLAVPGLNGIGVGGMRWRGGQLLVSFAVPCPPCVPHSFPLVGPHALIAQGFLSTFPVAAALLAVLLAPYQKWLTRSSRACWPLASVANGGRCSTPFCVRPSLVSLDGNLLGCLQCPRGLRSWLVAPCGCQCVWGAGGGGCTTSREFWDHNRIHSSVSCGPLD